VIGEMATRIFIEDNVPTIIGLVIGGSGHLKQRFLDSGWLDPRLAKIFIGSVDIASSGEIGLSQTIDFSRSLVSDLEFNKEKELIGEFLERISLCLNSVIFGIKETMETFEMGICKKLIIWEDLDYERVVTILGTFFFKTGAYQGEVIERENLVSYLISHHQKYGTHLELITGNTSAGSQFISGYGGFGGLLKCDYICDFSDFEKHDVLTEDFLVIDETEGLDQGLDEFF